MLTLNAIRVSKHLAQGRDMADYRVVVYINDQILFAQPIIGHDRALGWPDLLRRIAKAGEEAQRLEQRVIP